MQYIEEINRCVKGVMRSLIVALMFYHDSRSKSIF